MVQDISPVPEESGHTAIGWVVVVVMSKVSRLSCVKIYPSSFHTLHHYDSPTDVAVSMIHALALYDIKSRDFRMSRHALSRDFKT